MKISQDTFNKLITLVLLFYAIIMISLSFVLNRPIDIVSYTALLTPVATHAIHLISNKITDKTGSNGHS